MTQLKPGEMAPDAELLSSDSIMLHLSEVWDKRPTLLSFLRHFG